MKSVQVTALVDAVSDHAVAMSEALQEAHDATSLKNRMAALEHLVQQVIEVLLTGTSADPTKL